MITVTVPSKHIKKVLEKKNVIKNEEPKRSEYQFLKFYL